ncbi:MAG: hypothetical protein ACP5L5_02160 [Vulcanisaeta sp.]|uniref:hypothetical protein n=1 Tax=Vulcanisaeta sp. TaxID=2020871 RepID=UPI003D140CF3
MALIVAIASLSVILSLLIAVEALPSPIQSIRFAYGVASYYRSLQSSAPPGLIVRVYAINGSRVVPISAFVAVYGLTPRHIVPIAYGFGSVVNLPFNNTNWRFVANKWLLFNPSIGEYNTSLLVFVTYIDPATNRSWITAVSIPYNIGWVMNKQGSVRYIVLTAYINLTTKPFKLIPTKPPTIPSDQPIQVGPYTVYNCSEQGPSPPTFYEAGYYTTVYSPTTMCDGFTGPIPLAWVTWSNGIVNEYENYGLNLALQASIIGATDWYATGYDNGQFGTIGVSYSENVYWAENTGDILTSSVVGGGSMYIYYEGTFAIVNYSEYVYNMRLGIYEYVGQVPVVEVISVSTPAGSSTSTQALPGNYDFGNGPISYIYNGLIPLAEQELGYPVLNQSTVVTYASWQEGSNGPGCTILNPGQGPNELAWSILLESVDEQYRLSGPELGYELGGLGLETASSALAEFLRPFGIFVDLISPLVPLNTQINVQQTALAIYVPTSNANYVNWYVTIITASNAFGIPTFGFIVNATSYYQNPFNNLNCQG